MSGRFRRSTKTYSTALLIILNRLLNYFWKIYIKFAQNFKNFLKFFKKFLSLIYKIFYNIMENLNFFCYRGSLLAETRTLLTSFTNFLGFGEGERSFVPLPPLATPLVSMITCKVSNTSISTLHISYLYSTFKITSTCNVLCMVM